MEKLYIKRLKPKNLNLEKYILSLITYYKYGTTFKAICTYKDKKRTILQCGYRRRSVDDMYNIVKTQYPNLSFKTFCLLLKNILLKNKDIQLIYCNNVDKIVIYTGYFTYPSKKRLNGLIYDYNNFIKDGEQSEGIKLKKILKNMNYTEIQIQSLYR